MESFDEYSEERIPFGYLITFRSYGTWLHGTSGSVDRFHNIYGTPKLRADEKRKQYNRRLLKQPPVKLTAANAVQSSRQSKKLVKFVNGNYGLRTFVRTMFMQSFLPTVNQEKY